MEEIKIEKVEQKGIEIPDGGKNIFGLEKEVKVVPEEKPEEVKVEKVEEQEKPEPEEEVKKEEEEQELALDVIETKFEELKDKREEDLTDEDKSFLDKYTEEPFIDSIINEIGYKPEGKVFSDDKDGMIEYIKSLQEKAKSTAMEDVRKSEPEIVSRFKYFTEELGGDPREFLNTMYPAKDYSEIELKEEDVNAQKEIIREHGQIAKRTKENIEKEIDRLEEHGLLFDTSIDRQSELKEFSREAKENLIANQQEIQKAQAKEIEQYWDVRKDSLRKKETLELGIPIPTEKKEVFHDYRSLNADGKGHSQASIDFSSLNEDERELVDFVVFNLKNKKGNRDFLKTMANNRAVTERVRTLRGKYQKNSQERTRTTGGGSKTEGYQSWR